MFLINIRIYYLNNDVLYNHILDHDNIMRIKIIILPLLIELMLPMVLINALTSTHHLKTSSASLSTNSSKLANLASRSRYSPP